MSENRTSQWLDEFFRSLTEGQRPRLILAAITILAALLPVGLAFSRRPFCDESWFASPAYNLLKHGHMGTTVLDPTGFVFTTLVKDVDKYTYWVMPGYLMAQTVWYALVDFSLVSMRSLSNVFGIVALLSWYFIVHWLTASRGISLLAVLLLGTEEHFSLAAAMGRMDMMGAALNLLGLATYLYFRERNFRLALLLSCSVLAIGIFTHPNAIMGVAAVGGFALWLDRQKLRWSNVALAASPFLLIGGLWSLYILKAPDAFMSQMQAQAAIPHRFELPLNPLKAIWNELDLRYGPRYGFATRTPLALMRFVLFVYLASVLLAIAVPKLRKQTSVRVLLLLLGVNFSVLMCLQKNFYYLVYILPCYAALVALVANWMWTEPVWKNWRVPKWATALVLATIISLNLGVTGSRVVHNEYEGRFAPVVNLIKQRMSPGDQVIGSGELAFGLGFDGTALDDSRLGFLSGKRPRFIVIEGFYGIMWLRWFTVYEKATAAHINTMLANDYEVILDQAKENYPTYGMLDYPYKVYQRRQ